MDAADLRIEPLPVRVHASLVTEPVIERDEVVALLFNVSDMAVAIREIERILGENDGEEEADEG